MQLQNPNVLQQLLLTITQNVQICFINRNTLCNWTSVDYRFELNIGLKVIVEMT